MKRQKQKRNHWVPKAYLKSFAADLPTRKKIWTLSAKAGDPTLRPIDKVAVRFNLYAPRGEDGVRDYSFEQKLASLEQLFGNPGWQHISTGFPDLMGEATRKGLGLLTAVMFLRNPLCLEWTRQIHRQLVAFYSQCDELPEGIEIDGKYYEFDSSDWPRYRDADEDVLKRMWLDYVGRAVWLAKIFMKMRWYMLVSEEPVFITTDNPVIATHPELRFCGFRNPETSVIFPLSPTRALGMDNRHSEPDGQFYDAAKSAIAVNSLLWREAIEDMFSPRHPDLVCAEIVESARQEGVA